MTTEHPITPPPELVQEWWEEADKYQRSGDNAKTYFDHVAARAAQWGADMELEACIKWIQGRDWTWTWTSAQLRAARRPKPPSLKEQALQAADRFYGQGHDNCSDEDIAEDYYTIRRAIEALPND
jgi:hypothetical protein